MRLSIDHRTLYRFSAPQARLVQMLRMTPGDTHDQTIATWRIDVDCDARLKAAVDGFGNSVTMLYAAGPIDAIEICVSGEVLTNANAGVLRGASERFPPELFLRSTALTDADDALTDFAREAAVGTTALDRLHALNRAIHGRFTFCLQRPVQGRSAAHAFAEPRAPGRDLAHIFIAAARAIGAPARYVSGYGKLDVLGTSQPSPHGWAEAHIEGLGWVAFDPSIGLCAGEDHVRVSIGLDSDGAAPVAGSRLGEGDEQLAVDVHVAELDDQ
ncbi:MAG: transglutaminase [Sphingomonas sp. 28-62-20]|uniref:transglutaminase family protein n=1 Tax=Sphingomonas sp. 28-62-20 TaxID=1970433 RepID=UPI000B1377BF|nr:MAG: transglutaminase [Sphingomonas sp. 28-62-20]